jgi:cation diffusion facilitator CzcD-associated flavoprotein CzcO
VTFDDLAGARVAVIGGRQSAYEWTALLCDHGAARVDVVHRHPTPDFAKVSWQFVDEYVEQTLAQRGWWRGLQADQQARISQRFWDVGRLTLEHWLVPRLTESVVHRHPGTEVVAVEVSDDGPVRLTLADGDVLEVDHVVFASGFKADLARVPYLAGVHDRIEVADGFPALDEAFGASLPGLYLPGFPATRDFGPFFGFVKGTSAAATLIVDDLLARA